MASLSDLRNIRQPGVFTVLGDSTEKVGTSLVDGQGPTGPTGPTGPIGATGPDGSGSAILVEGGNAVKISNMSFLANPPANMPFVPVAVTGDSTKNYKSPLNTLLVMPPLGSSQTANVEIIASTPAGGTGSAVVIESGTGGAAGGSGGEVAIVAGSAQFGNSTGGTVQIFSGTGAGLQAGGNIVLTAGNGGSGGQSIASGGSLFLTAGNASGLDAEGGNIVLSPGLGIAATDGQIIVTLPSADPNVTGAIWSDDGTVVLSGATAQGGAPPNFAQINNVTINGSEYTPGTVTTVTLYTPSSGDQSTIEVLGIFLSVTTDWGQKYTATLTSIDQITSVVSSYGTSGTITGALSQVPVSAQILSSSGQGQIVALEITNQVTSSFNCDILLIYQLSAPLDVPTLPGIVEPALYTGARLSTVNVNPSSTTFPELRWVFANQVTFNVIASGGDTTMTILNSSNSPTTLPSGWKSGMVLYTNSAPAAPANSTYTSAGVSNPYVTQVVPPWPPGTTGTTLTSGSITLSNPVTHAFSGTVTACWPALAEGGTIALGAGNQNEPVDIPPVFSTPITIIGTKSGSVLQTILDGRGGVGSGTAFRLSFGKGFIHLRTPATIQNISFKNCGGADGVGDGEAAIYVESFWATGTANIVNCSFDNCEDGIFAPQNANIAIAINGCDFGFDKPNGASNDGLSHDFYINCETVTVQNSFFYGSLANCLKSRSPNLTVENTYISHLGDRAIDYPEGGALAVSDSIITSQNRDNVNVVANYIGYKDEPATVTINASSNVSITDSWITTNRFNDEWWISPAITVNVTDSMIEYCDSQGGSLPSFQMDTENSPALGTVVWTYDSVSQVVFPTDTVGSPATLIPLITPGVRAFNITTISSLTLDNNTVSDVATSGTIVGNFDLVPTIASLGSGSAQAVLLNNPNFNTNTGALGYFQIVSASTDSGIALATNQNSVPAATYNLMVLVMAPYSSPQVFTISVTSGAAGVLTAAITEAGSAADSVNEHDSTFKSTITEAGSAADTVTASDVPAPMVVAAFPDNFVTDGAIGIALATTSGTVPSSVTATWSGSGGSATVTNTVVNGMFTTFNATTPSSAGTYTLSVTGSGHTVTTGNIVIAAATSDFSSGIYGPSTVVVGTNLPENNDQGALPVASYFARGLTGPQSANLTGADAAKFVLAQPDPFLTSASYPMNGWTLYQTFGSYNQAQTTFTISVNITDGSTTHSMNVTVDNPQTGNTFAPTTNVVFDSSTNSIGSGMIGVASLNGSFGSSTFTFTPDSGSLFSVTGNLIQIAASNLIAANFGSHNVTVTPSGGSAYTFPLYIAHESKPTVVWSPLTSVYTSTPITDQFFSSQIGTVSFWSDSGLISFYNSSTPPIALTSNPNSLETWAHDPFYGLTGATYLTTSLTEGYASGTAQITSGNGLTSNLILKLPVINGTTFPNTDMAGTVSSGLTNFNTSANANPNLTTGSPVTVLTLTQSGFTPDWSLTTLNVLNDNCQLTLSNADPSELGTYVPRYAISGSGTSATVTAWNLSAINETTPQTDQLQITTTDGNGNFCTNIFDIVTSWHPYTGAALSVGPGGTWTTANAMFEALTAAPATYAGATITVLYGVGSAPTDWHYGTNEDFTGGWWPCPIHLVGDSSTQATFTGSISGTTLTVSSSTGLVAGQWINSGAGTGTLLLSQIDSTHWTVSVSQTVSSTSMTTVWPQIPLDFDNNAPGGSSQGGLMCAGGYDLIVERLEISRVSNGTNAGAIWKVNGNAGNLTINHCYFHHCDNGFINGDNGNRLFITNNLFAANGGNGHSHNFYCDGSANLSFTGNYSVDSIGHELKSRALFAQITNNFLLEGVNWQGQDTPIETPSGGIYTFSHNVVMKGCYGYAANNGGIADIADEATAAADAHPAYPSIFTALNNTFINLRDIGAPLSNDLGNNQPTVGFRNWMNYDPIRVEIPVESEIAITSFYNMAPDTWSVASGPSYTTAFPLIDSTNLADFPFTGIALINPLTGGAPFNLPYLALNNQATATQVIGSAPGTYAMIMTVPSGSPTATPVTGGNIALYQVGSLTPVSATWSIIGGTNAADFSISTSGDLAQINTSGALSDGFYGLYVQAVGGITATQYYGIIVGTGAYLAAITESGSASDTTNFITLSAAITESGSASDTTNASIPAAPALISHTQGTGQNGSTSGSINTTGASLIVVNITTANFNTVTQADLVANFSDSKGNTWSSFVTETDTPGGRMNILLYAISPTVGTGHTFTSSQSGQFGGFSVCAFSNVASFDQTTNAGGSSLTTIQAGSLTPTNSGSLLVTCGVFDDSSLPSIDSGFTIADGFTNSSGVVGGSIAYFVQTTAAAINPTWTQPDSGDMTAILASFNS